MSSSRFSACAGSQKDPDALSIKPEVKQVIKNIWFDEDFARNQGTREMLYEKLTAIANINKWEKIPSYQTVTRYIGSIP